jgi:hypothetical protein
LWLLSLGTWDIREPARARPAGTCTLLRIYSPGNADGHTSEDDGAGDPVAYARLLAYHARFPGSSKPAMAYGLLDNRRKFAKRKILSGEHYDTA